MKKIFWIIIILFVFSGTASAETENKADMLPTLNSIQDKKSANTKEDKYRKKVANLKSKLAMILIMGKK